MSVPSELVAYETLDEGRIARIWLNRPEAHNAQRDKFISRVAR